MRKAKWIGALIVAVLVAYAAQAVITKIDLAGYNSTTSMNYQTGAVYNAAVDELGTMTAKINELTAVVNQLATTCNAQHGTDYADDTTTLEAY